MTTVELKDILRMYVSQKSRKSSGSTTASVSSHTICSITAACPEGLSQTSVAVSMHGKEFSALIDTGISDSFIGEQVVKFLKLPTHPSSQNI